MSATDTGAKKGKAAKAAAKPDPKPGTGKVGVRELVKLASRRDRIMLPLWCYALIGSCASTAYSIKGLYGTAAARQSLVDELAAAPAAAALYGKIYGDSLGSITAWRAAVATSILAAVMSILLVVRHTRAEEQTGRMELVVSGAVDRFAPLGAALQLTMSVNLSVGVVIGAVLPFLGVPAAGAFLLGLSIAGVGLFFTAVAAVTAQLFESSRAANGAAFAILGVFYLIRAAGDMSPATWLLWLSPIGWVEQARPYSGDHWWVLALAAGGTVLVVAAAVRLSQVRDFGSGLLPSSPGPRYGGADTRGVFGLAWRIHRGTLAGWAFGIFIGAAAFGSFAKDIDVLTSSARVEKIMAQLGGSQNMANSYLATIMNVFAVLTAAFAVTVIVRARGEETSGRIEVILAGIAGRTRWVLSHVLFAAFGSAVLLAVGGLGAGAADALRTHQASAVRTLLGAELAQWPAVLVVTTIAALLFAAVPAWTGAAWGVFGLVAFLTLAAPELNAGQALLDISPFNQVPKVPAVPYVATPLLVLSAVAIALLAGTVTTYRRRDLAP
jgi:ABC-2 type transport system permease protein